MLVNRYINIIKLEINSIVCVKFQKRTEPWWELWTNPLRTRRSSLPTGTNTSWGDDLENVKKYAPVKNLIAQTSIDHYSNRLFRRFIFLMTDVLCK